MDTEENGRGLIDGMAPLDGVTEVTKVLKHNSRCPGRNSNLKRRKNVLEKTPLEPLSYSSMGRQELYYNLVLQNDKHSPRWVLQFEKFLHVVS